MTVEQLDARGLRHPQPVRLTSELLAGLPPGGVAWVTTTAPDSLERMAALCASTGHELLQHMQWRDEFGFLIRKPQG